MPRQSINKLQRTITLALGILAREGNTLRKAKKHSGKRNSTNFEIPEITFTRKHPNSFDHHYAHDPVMRVMFFSIIMRVKDQSAVQGQVFSLGNVKKSKCGISFRSPQREISLKNNQTNAVKDKEEGKDEKKKRAKDNHERIIKKKEKEKKNTGLQVMASFESDVVWLGAIPCCRGSASHAFSFLC